MQIIEKILITTYFISHSYIFFVYKKKSAIFYYYVVCKLHCRLANTHKEKKSGHRLGNRMRPRIKTGLLVKMQSLNIVMIHKQQDIRSRPEILFCLLIYFFLSSVNKPYDHRGKATGWITGHIMNEQSQFELAIFILASHLIWIVLFSCKLFLDHLVTC